MQQSNRPQVITPEAKHKFAMTEFEKVDTNRTGDIDPAEFMVYLNAKVIHD